SQVYDDTRHAKCTTNLRLCLLQTWPQHHPATRQQTRHRRRACTDCSAYLSVTCSEVRTTFRAISFDYVIVVVTREHLEQARHGKPFELATYCSTRREFWYLLL